MLRLSLAAVFFLLVSPVATAEIFKCVGAKGVIVYQNFRCEIDSIGSSATAQPPPEAKPAATIAAAGKRPEKTEPRVGMTRRQVAQSTWGQPNEIKEGDYAVGQPEVWIYAGKGRIEFDNEGEASAVNQ